jgi:amidase
MTIKPTRVHAFNHADALGHHDAVALAGQLQRGETSATALVQAAYQRLELVNPELHATTT